MRKCKKMKKPADPKWTRRARVTHNVTCDTRTWFLQGTPYSLCESTSKFRRDGKGRAVVSFLILKNSYGGQFVAGRVRSSRRAKKFAEKTWGAEK